MSFQSRKPKWVLEYWCWSQKSKTVTWPPWERMEKPDCHFLGCKHKTQSWFNWHQWKFPHWFQWKQNWTRICAFISWALFTLILFRKVWGGDLGAVSLPWDSPGNLCQATPWVWSVCPHLALGWSCGQQGWAFAPWRAICSGRVMAFPSPCPWAVNH